MVNGEANKNNFTISKLVNPWDKDCQLLATGQWFSPVSSTNKYDRHDITEILLKVKHYKPTN